jgi:hypothetical protein
MRRGYCDDCGAQRPFRRAFGWGTFFAVLVTLGGWILALPFYPLRCPQCGRTFSGSTPAPSISAPGMGRLDWLFLVALIMAILVLAALQHWGGGV